MDYALLENGGFLGLSFRWHKCMVNSQTLPRVFFLEVVMWVVYVLIQSLIRPFNLTYFFVLGMAKIFRCSHTYIWVLSSCTCTCFNFISMGGCMARENDICFINSIILLS